jgi:Leucine-rich repeat (LRR) protein
MAHHVFISYSSKDKTMADAVCHYLEQERIKCWIAPRDVRLGTNFAEEIVDAIPASKVMVIIFSVNSNASKQVMRELELAIKNDLIVIPVRIEDIIPTGGMAYYLSTMQWIDIIDKKTDYGLTKLTERIENVLGILKDESTSTVGNSFQFGAIQEKALERNEKSQPTIKSGKFAFTFPKMLISALVIIAIVIAIIFLPKQLMKSNGSPSENPISSEGVTSSSAGDELSALVENEGMASDPLNQVTPDPAATTIVDFTDATLENAVRSTLTNMGEIIGEKITAADMLKLKYLLIASETVSEELELQTNEPTEFNLKYLLVGVHPLQRTRSILLNTSILETLEDRLIIIDDDIKSLDGLEYAENLTELMVADKNVSDLSPLTGLSDLEMLYLDGNEISDLTPLSGMTHLKELYLNNNLIQELNGIEALSSLINLNLNNNQISDINMLAELKNLENLSLGSNNITNIDVFKEMGYLDGVDLSFNWLPDISALSSLRKANWIRLVKCQPSDTSIFDDFLDLEWLNIMNNDLDNEGIYFLHTQQKLIGLWLAGNQFDNIEFISWCKTLTVLWVAKTNLYDATPLGTLINLQELQIEQNVHDNIECILNLDQLKRLYTSGEFYYQYYDNIIVQLIEKGVSIRGIDGGDESWTGNSNKNDN